MTVFESEDLDVGDLVACGDHLGVVVSVEPHSVKIKWSDAVSVTHQRDQMWAIRRAEYSRQGS